jgi:hypothetical protein
MAKLIDIDGEVTQVQPKNESKFTLDELQGYVGGYIEVVPQFKFSRKVFLVDEEGLLKGLEMNLIATGLISQPLFGNVLVLDVEEWE